ncbi:MAG TPA: hypothetical protein VFK23_11510 [Nitrospirota bacterium]|nr:hypothetical protein [Nitrospirota bacterium]
MKLPFKLQPENPAHEDISSYAVDRVFISPEGLGPGELRSLARDAVRTVAAGCEAAGAKDVSHVKLYLEHESGFIHANAVSGNPEITVAGRDGVTAKQFRLVMNAVIYGLSEYSIRTSVEQGIEAVQIQYGLTLVTAQGKNH